MGISLKMRLVRFATAVALTIAGHAQTVVAAPTQMISDVSIEDVEGVTRVILRGAEDPIYTAFMRDDPPRLIIELPDVAFEGVSTPISVGNDLVRDVTLGAFGDPRVALSMARVSISLMAASEYELLPRGNELVIEIRPLAGGTSSDPEVASTDAPAESPAPSPMAAAEAVEPEEIPASVAPTSDEDPQALTVAEPAEQPSDVEQALAPNEGEAEIEEASLPSVGTILKVVSTDDQIAIVADGSIDNVDSFTLEEPDRLVVDLWGVQSSVWPASFTVEHGAVNRVRVGSHADKVRVVLDLAAPLLSHEIEPTGQGVLIALTPDTLPAEVPEEVAENEAVPAAPAEDDTEFSDVEESLVGNADPEPVADEPEEVETPSFESTTSALELEVTPPSEASVQPEEETAAFSPAQAAQVESIHFESLPSMDRLVLSLSREVDAKLVAPDAATLIVTLSKARIAPETERRVDTREFGGPVEIFTTFQTPDVSYDEVRVVLKRQEGAEAHLSWEGNQLRVELPRIEGPETGSLDEEETQPFVEIPAAEQPAAEQPSPASAVFDASSEASTSRAAVDPQSLEDEFFLDGPAAPAAIDILAEGGFSEEKSYSGRRISLDFKDADIGNILRLIAEVSDLNVIAGAEVSGEVTIRLVDVPWDQALDVILLTRGLGFVRVGNVLRIAPLETIKLEAEARLQERRAKEKLEDLIVKLQPVNFADVGEIKTLVQHLLSARGSVNVDARTSTLIIKDIPSVIHEATALVKAIDTQTPQVLIEAKIVEATLNFSRSLGAVWGLRQNPIAGNKGGAPDLRFGDGSFNNSVDGPDFPDGQLNHFLVQNPASGSRNGVLTLGLLALNDQLQLDLSLQAAEANDKGKVISSPRVVTLDNREAVIKQGVAIRFTEATADRITTSFVDAVLELKVTPHITANRSIIMKIKVSRNAPQLSNVSGAVVGIAKNETETEALVRDGETIVLGGIYVVDSGHNNTKVPFLGDLPLLGAMFRSTFNADERRELLVFVTPRIVLAAPDDL